MGGGKTQNPVWRRKMGGLCGEWCFYSDQSHGTHSALTFPYSFILSREFARGYVRPGGQKTTLKDAVFLGQMAGDDLVVWLVHELRGPTCLTEKHRAVVYLGCSGKVCSPPMCVCVRRCVCVGAHQAQGLGARALVCVGGDCSTCPLELLRALFCSVVRS